MWSLTDWTGNITLQCLHPTLVLSYYVFYKNLSFYLISLWGPLQFSSKIGIIMVFFEHFFFSTFFIVFLGFCKFFWSSLLKWVFRMCRLLIYYFIVFPHRLHLKRNLSALCSLSLYWSMVKYRWVLFCRSIDN